MTAIAYPHVMAAAVRGAVWLDEAKPGWASRIDTATLDIDDIHHCILGQLFKEEAEASSSYGTGFNWVRDTRFGGSSSTVRGFGFNYDGHEVEDGDLAWRQLIKDRLAPTI